MMYKLVAERIDAYVIYKHGAKYPILRAFRWKMRRFDITSINLVYPEREGETLFLYYAVSSGRNHFQLRLNTNRCLWTLEAIDVEE